MVQGLSWPYVSTTCLGLQLNNNALLELAGNAFSAFAVLPLLVAVFATADLPVLTTLRGCPQEGYQSELMDLLDDTP